ncbi:MAG TPA: NAD-dependent epimerase/dehydratase family protein [Usitatibacter sp.]|nr:NAD-dependent epimerase/dehydratase family protein [Usitatibacter sp.]
MKVLVLGGTVFLGRAFTDAALEAGIEIVHFNRGQSAPADARVARIAGDRNDAEALQKAASEGPWDAVIDTSGYLPQLVRKSATAMRDRAARYLFVSSISAYAGKGFHETSPLQPVPDPLPDTMTPDKYGALKAGCEAAAQETFGERAIVVRPGLIVGPHDPTDRFTWWPHRVALGGRVAAPGRPVRSVQFIDVRDLARWMVRIVEKGAAGVFNAVGPRVPLTMQEVLEACRAVSASDARFEWIAEDFLAASDVQPWKEMPLWVPESNPDHAGFMEVPIVRAIASGLTFRSLRDTVADTLDWSLTRSSHHAWKAGLPSSREAELLRSWDARPREGARS